jgi:hypothetical protein
VSIHNYACSELQPVLSAYTDQRYGFALYFSERKEPPVITRPPTEKEVREGMKVRFDAAVTGNPKPTITWFVRCLAAIQCH